MVMKAKETNEPKGENTYREENCNFKLNGQRKIH